MINKRAVFILLTVGIVPLPASADVKISSAATQNMNCSEGVCTPSAANALLNVGDVETMLAAGDLTIETAGSGGVQAKDIVVDATFSWSSQSGLALDAYRSIAVNKAVSVSGIAALDLTTNDGVGKRPDARWRASRDRVSRRHARFHPCPRPTVDRRQRLHRVRHRPGRWRRDRERDAGTPLLARR